MEISTTRKSDKSTFDAAVAALTLARGDAMPLHAQLANELKRLILQRILPPGSRLPASRPLADELGVSRVTVVAAVSELIAEGYADGRRGSGVYVAADLPDQALKTPSPGVASALPERASVQLPSVFGAHLARPSALRPAAPEAALFPHEIWARLMLRTWRDPAKSLLAEADPAGYLPLRQAIARHLAEFRNMELSPGQVIVTSGANEGIELIARALLPQGSRVLVEEPGYPSIWHTLAELGLKTVHVPIDADGFDIAKAEVAAAAVLVTPSRHYPTGATMPLTRRLGLIEWTRRTGGFIIEDDYDSEYRYRGRPLPTLASLSNGSGVIYIGSFSKTMLPGLRLGFLAVPPALADRFQRKIAERGARASLMMQPVLSRFIVEGYYGTHIRRMRRLYAKRQAALLAALDTHAKGILAAESEPAGMHLICTLMNGVDDREAEARAKAAGITAPALSGFFAGPPARRGLLLGYAGFDEATIERAMKRLVEVLER